MINRFGVDLRPNRRPAANDDDRDGDVPASAGHVIAERTRTAESLDRGGCEFLDTSRRFSRI
jgi:hypothetical protein